MKREFSLRLIIFFTCVAIAIGMFYQPISSSIVSAEEKEMRGVWISTVSNIDFPSKQTTDSKQLKKELTEIFDHCKEMGFNSVFFQVRPAGDAFYHSDIYPWSKYLTGTQGVAPDNGFDPLSFAVEEAHKRGIELHAWINPYRITTSAEDNECLADSNPAKMHSELVLQDADGKMYYNPGHPDAIQLIIDGAMEIIKNYDVDGLHMDDYFYPESNFNDDDTYALYNKGYDNKNEWRRAMVNQLVRSLDTAIHKEKPNIAFGISPRGIWANESDMPDGSKTRGGGSYNTVFADSKAWVDNEWVDYIIPQIYWNIGYEAADYKVLCDWWSDVVAGTDVKLYIGEGAYRTISSTAPEWEGESGINEMKRHIQLGRDNKNISGYCMFTYNTFLNNTELSALMKKLNISGAENKEEVVSTNTTPLVGADKTDKSDGLGNTFTDMDEFWWAKEEVDALYSQGIIRGQSETIFAPSAPITRADNTVLLLRILGKNVDFVHNFDDVLPDAYYYREIGMAKELGITNGDGHGCFNPLGLIKRQDMVTLAYRVLVKEGKLTTIPNTAVLNEFTDKDLIDFYARDAMAACIDAGLIKGDYEYKLLKPQDTASRVEVAIFMFRIQKLLNEK